MYSRLAAALAVAGALLPIPTWAQLEAENLLTGLPDGFKVGFRTEQNGMLMTELIPEAETVENWSAMITVQIFRGRQNIDGDAFAADLQRLWQEACAGAAAERLGAGDTNGYPFVLWTYGCPLNQQSGTPETMWLKAISGADAFYVVQYAHRGPPGDAASEEAALGYLEAASACDTRKPAHACPAGM